MTHARSLAAFASLLADETRAALCLALLDGRAWTAGELATHVGVARSTVTEHLHRLVGGGLLAERRQGRHRYVCLAAPWVATLLEDLGGHARAAPPPRGLRAVSADAALRRGRTCYDHLAGRLGVAITDAMAGRGLLDPGAGLALTPAGAAWVAETLDPPPARHPAGPRGGAPANRRPAVRDCLDWTERRSHLGGAVGAALCTTFLDRGWIVRGAGRAVRTTPAGRDALADLLGVGADV